MIFAFSKKLCILQGNNMIDLPIGKALIAVYSDIQCKQECMDPDFQCQVKDCCKGCELDPDTLGSIPDCETCGCLACIPCNRKDGKNVIYKLIDFPS